MCKDHTSYTKKQFLTISNHLTSLKNSPARTKIQALVVYLKWLKTGLTQIQLALYFGIQHRQSISDYCQQVRDAMIKDCVPLFLGASHLPRKQWIDSNTTMAKVIFDMLDNHLCLVADGT